MTPVTEIPVDIPGHDYVVYVGEGLLGETGERVRALSRASRAAIVTDRNAASVALPSVVASLQGAGLDVTTLTVEPGERSKTWQEAGRVLDSLAEAGLDRTDVVIGLGGGVVGDLAGFCAASFLRGVDLVQLPTTLLAQVDSSVGGKTGVDLRAGKNLAGAFKQPVLVLADTGALRTLPASEWSNGLAEVAKSSVIDGEDFLTWVEEQAGALAGCDTQAAHEAVSRSVAFKARVVTVDERESGPRECLNYGHTFGHALEKVAGYGSVSHGMAVAEGIRFASRLAVAFAGVPTSFGQRQARLLDALGIPRVEGDWSAAELRDAMSSDKKVRGDSPRFVLALAPGEWRVATVPEALLGEVLEGFVREMAEGSNEGAVS